MRNRNRIVLLSSLMIGLSFMNSYVRGSVFWASAFGGFMIGAIVVLVFHLTRPVFRTHITTTVPATEPAWVVIRVSSAPTVAWIAVPVPLIEGRDRDLRVFVSPEGPVSEVITISDDPSPSSPQWN